MRTIVAHVGSILLIAFANAVVFTAVAAIDILIIHPDNRVLQTSDELLLGFEYAAILSSVVGLALALPIVLVLRRTIDMSLPKLAATGAIAAVGVCTFLEGLSQRSALFVLICGALGVLSASLWWALIERGAQARG